MEFAWNGGVLLSCFVCVIYIYFFVMHAVSCDVYFTWYNKSVYYVSLFCTLVDGDILYNDL